MRVLLGQLATDAGIQSCTTTRGWTLARTLAAARNILRSLMSTISEDRWCAGSISNTLNVPGPGAL
jgi:hypothetical protein